MSDEILHLPPNKSLPAEVRAGDFLTWAVETDNLAAGTVLFYVLTGVINNALVSRRLGGSGVAIDADGTATFVVESSDSTGWTPGSYAWMLFSLDTNANRTQLAQGRVKILPDVVASPQDPRTENEKLLAAVQQLLAGKALDDAAMYKIGGRELTKMPLKDLLSWEGVLEARVRRARRRRGEFVPTKTIGITFGGR